MSVNKNNLIPQQTQVIQSSTTPTPIVIQLPSQLYPQEHNSNANSHATSPNTLSSINEFFDNLDQKHNCNVYSNFKAAFLDEKITVNIIKELSNEQLQKLGVVKIGW